MGIKVKTKWWMVVISCLAVLSVNLMSDAVFADSQFSVSPMTQKIILSPGEQYRGSFEVVNPVSNDHTFHYTASVEPFFVDENYNTVFENNGDYNQIINWTVLDNAVGEVEPNNTMLVDFTINVPEDAPAGGQYMTIKIISDEDVNTLTGGLNIQNIMSIAHLVFAEVAGNTVRTGTVLDVDVPSFMLLGNIYGSSTVKNTGNVHDTAKYTLQVFPLFSSEEVYTNEEHPDEKNIMPERELYNRIEWNDTPAVGIFNVIYTVEFQDTTTQVSKMVIKCPIWLLFIIIFVIFALIFYFVARARARKKAAKK